MPAPRSGAWRWIAVGVLLPMLAAWPHSASAMTRTSYDVNDGAVVQVIVRTASIAIHTWSRNTVQIDASSDGFSTSKGVQPTRPSFLIPTVSVEEDRSPAGSIVATLLPEDFPVPKLVPGLHDVVRVVEDLPPAPAGRPLSAEHLTVTIPETTGLVNIRSGRGPVTLRDYRGTTIASAGRGRIVFQNVSGDAFVQPLNGHFYAVNSVFDRLRIRSNRASEVFDACRVAQIEATTLTGAILFDNGTFDPGLARFESDRGSIALGVNGGAQLGAHTDDGHVLSALPAQASPDAIGRDDVDTAQLVGGGGPLVNASTVHGDLFLYDGSLANRRTLPPPWRSMLDLLESDRGRGRRFTEHRQPLRRVAPRRHVS